MQIKVKVQGDTTRSKTNSSEAKRYLLNVKIKQQDHHHKHLILNKKSSLFQISNEHFKQNSSKGKTSSSSREGTSTTSNQ